MVRQLIACTSDASAIAVQYCLTMEMLHNDNSCERNINKKKFFIQNPRHFLWSVATL